MRWQECQESACGQRRAEHHDMVPASPVSIATRSCPSPPNHPKNGLGSVRQSENWQKIALLCHPFFRHLPRLCYLNTSSHQKCTVWVRSAPCPCHEHGKRVPKMQLVLPVSQLRLKGLLRAHLPSPSFQFAKFHHQKALNFPGKPSYGSGVSCGTKGSRKGLGYCWFGLIKWRFI